MFEKGPPMNSPMNEYHEKTPPMIFRKIGPPINLPEIGSPMDEMTPPMGYLLEEPSDDYSREEPSDEHRVEKAPPMTIGEGPSDENVRQAVSSLLELTRCRCHQEIGDQYGHDIECNADWRADVVVLVAAAGWTAPGAVVRERYA